MVEEQQIRNPHQKSLVQREQEERWEGEQQESEGYRKLKKELESSSAETRPDIDEKIVERWQYREAHRVERSREDEQAVLRESQTTREWEKKNNELVMFGLENMEFDQAQRKEVAQQTLPALARVLQSLKNDNAEAEEARRNREADRQLASRESETRLHGVQGQQLRKVDNVDPAKQGNAEALRRARGDHVVRPQQAFQLNTKLAPSFLNESSEVLTELTEPPSWQVSAQT